MATLPEIPEDDPFGLGEEEDPNDDGDDEYNQLLGRKPSNTPVRATSTTRGERNYENEGARPKTTTSTSYFSNPAYEEQNEKTPLITRNKEEDQKEAKRDLLGVRLRAKLQVIPAFFQKLKNGIEVLAVKGPSGGTYVYNANEDEFFRYDTKREKIMEKLKPGKLKDALGPRRSEILEEKNSNKKKIKESQNKKKERIKFLKEQPLKTPEVRTEIETLNREVEEDENEMESIDQESEQILETMSLRERIKYIFKKYGFTVTAILISVGTVIGVIVSSLSKGLSSLGRGVGNGLKTLGKKLGEIFPGMVGAIVSFLFKTAGEVIGFLGKNAWLLIMAVVLYFVENIKKKRN